MCKSLAVSGCGQDGGLYSPVAPSRRRPHMKLILASLLLILAAAAAPVPAGDEDFPDDFATSAARSDEQFWSALAASSWLGEGPVDAARTVYVFMDPECPYCHRFWQAVQPWVSAGGVQVRYVLVDLLGAESTRQAMAILAATDPGAAFRAHESGEEVPAAPAGTSDAAPAVLRGNLELFRELGFHAVPSSVFRGEDGALHRWPGLPAPADMADLLGPLPAADDAQG